MAKTTADLSSQIVNIDVSNDGLVNKKNSNSFSTTLDVTGITDQVLNVGRVIIKKASGVFAPQTITNGAYVAPAEDETYAGVLAATILTSKPFAAVVDNGIFNEAAMVLAPTAAAKEALPFVQFTNDK